MHLIKRIKMKFNWQNERFCQTICSKGKTRFHDDARYVNRAPVAQLVGRWAVTWEAVSSTPAGPTLRVESAAFLITSANG